MPLHDVVVIGGSAGALEALREITEGLPASLRACVLIVVHTSLQRDGVLPNILSNRSALPVSFAGDFDPLSPGRIYVAPADRHLLATDAGLRVVHGPRENGFRPAIDPLFRTAARHFGPRVIGIVLSGALSDGVYGLSIVKQHGGIAIVQDPDDAVIDSMPKNAIASVAVDHVVPAKKIAAIVMHLSGQTTDTGEPMMAPPKDLEPQLPSEETSVKEMEERYGAPSSLTCPDCGGALWEAAKGRVLRYQCHVGHQYAPDVLETEQRDAVDSALWSAVRVLEEHAELKTRMAARARSTRLSGAADTFERGARQAHAQAQQIRRVLFAAGDAGAAEISRRAAAAVRTGVPRKITRTKRRPVK